MQCNVEPVEEGAKYHVSLCCNIYSLIIYSLRFRFTLLTNNKILFQPFVFARSYRSKGILIILSMLSVSSPLANITAETGG